MTQPRRRRQRPRLEPGRQSHATMVVGTGSSREPDKTLLSGLGRFPVAQSGIIVALHQEERCTLALRGDHEVARSIPAKILMR